MDLKSAINRLFGLDLATSAAIGARIWSFLSGPVTLLMVVRFLSPEQQGYLGIFDSLVAIRIFVELGLSTILMQFVSHERGDLITTANRRLAGNEKYRGTLGALLRTSLRWFVVISLVTLVVLYFSGFYYFTKTESANQHIAWRWPLLLLSVNTACSLCMQPFFGVLEGMGKIAEFFIVGLFNSVLTSLTLWGGLALGWDLMAIPASAFVGILASCVSLYRWRHLFQDLLSAKTVGPPVVCWRKDILPLQLRTAIAAVLGYFIFNLTLPIVFATLGSVASGQLGQSLRLSSMILNLSNAWIITRAALYGRLISIRDQDQLNRLFRKSVKMAVFTAVLGCLMLGSILAMVYLVRPEHIPHSVIPLYKVVQVLPQRLGSASLLMALAANTILSSLVYALHSFVRAHRKEPFIVNAVIAAVSVPLITYWGATKGSLEWIAWGYAVRTLLIEIPLTIVIFEKTSSVKLRDLLGVRATPNPNLT